MHLSINKRMTSKVVGVAALCVLAFSSWAAAQTLQPKATQATPVPQAAAQSRWEVICTSSPAGLDCRAGQSLAFMGEQGRLIVALNIPPDTKIPIMILRVPHGLYLPAGIVLQFGNDAAKRLAIESCDRNGCVANHPVTAAEIAAMLNGADLTISAQNLQKQPVTVRVSVSGFSAAYAKIK
jgi:invasion protein IalB